MLLRLNEGPCLQRFIYPFSSTTCMNFGESAAAALATGTFLCHGNAAFTCKREIKNDGGLADRQK